MRSLIFALLVSCFGWSQMAAQGIEFFHGSFEEALEEAKKQEKLIFVDAYTTWCGPCKRMARNVFPLSEVGEFYNANFINLKLDMEKPAGISFGQKYPVSAYPTFYYIDEKGETVLQTKGGRTAEDFVALGQSAVGKVDRSVDYVEAYENGDRSPELVYNYVKALNKAGKPSLKIANDYIRSQKDLSTPDNLKFLLEATTQADSRIFDLMIQHRPAIEKLASKEAVQIKIEKACQKTLATAIEYNSPDLLAEAKDKMSQHYGSRADQFAFEADMTYYQATLQPDAYLKACQGCAKKEIKKDADKLHKLANNMLTAFPKDKKVLEAAEGFAQKATKFGGQFDHYKTYAQILYKNGKKKDALTAANKCLQLASGQPLNEKMAKQLIRVIENS